MQRERAESRSPRGSAGPAALRWAPRGIAAGLLVALISSCASHDFEALRESVQPGRDLAALIDSEVGAYLLDQRVKSFNGVRYSSPSSCEASSEQEQWLAGASPAVAIQSWNDGFHLALTVWDPSCGEQGCRRDFQEYGPLTRAQLGQALREAGCSLAAGMEFRLESPPRLLPPMSHRFFLVRFDEHGRTATVSSIAAQGDAAKWD